MGLINELPALTRVGWEGFFLSGKAFKKPEAIQKFQNASLRQAVSIAYYDTEFYKEKYDRHGVHPDDILTAADLPKLPVVTKQELVDHSEAAIPSSLNKNKAFLLGTSGSTGQPIRIYKDYHWLAHILSSGLRAMRMHKLGLPNAAYIFDSGSSYNLENTVQNYLKIFPSPAAIIDVSQDIVQIMAELEKIKPRYILTYAGVMRELATLRKNGMGNNLKLRKVGLTGEILDHFTRQHIEEAFGCECFGLYSSTEGGLTAWECVNKKMHLSTDSVTVEIVDEQGTPLPAGLDGNVLLTCHDRGLGTPIIRYAGCSDVGQLSDEPCDCGVHTPILGQVKGRVVDSIHLPDGRVFHAFYLTIPMEKIQREKGKERICQYQIVQHALDRITISLVRNREKADPLDTLSELFSAIEQEYRELFGDGVNIVVQEVRELPRDANPGIPTPLIKSKIGMERAAAKHNIHSPEERTYELTLRHGPGRDEGAYQPVDTPPAAT